MKKILFSIQIAFLMGSVCLYGQSASDPQKSCLFEEAKDEHYKNDPNARKQAEEFENVVSKMVKSKMAQANKAGESFVVPVVFHVYGKDFPAVGGVPRVVNDDIIKQALKAVNDNFKGFNDAVDSKFSSIEGGMNVVFKLAQIDPNGNTTTGIVYHENKSGFGLNGTSDVEIAKYAWDNYKYFNVHIQLNIKTLASDTQSGVAWFPATNMSDEGTARVVYNGRYLIYSPPASSLTHEFGHFFGLQHAFEGGCVAGADKGDLVADTPPTVIVSGACNLDGKNCFNNFINVQNHMDYNPCESMFTKGQVARMESFMTHPARVTLWQDTNLTATGIKNNLGPRIVFNFQDIQDNDTYKYTSLNEDFDNTGKITGRRKLKAVDGAKFAKSGSLVLNTDFRVENLPSGITARINVINDTTAELFFEGSTANHTAANSGTLKITLLNPSIVGGVASIFTSSGTYKYQFLDPYTIRYASISPNILGAYGQASGSGAQATTISSLLINGDLLVGLNNFDGDKIVIDNKDSKFQVLCQPNTSNAIYFAENVEISGTTAGVWKTQDCEVKCPEPILSSPDYNAWHGKTGYVAIRIPTLNNSYTYGWIKATVRTDGQVAWLSNVGLNLRFGASIRTTIVNPNLTYSNGRFLEAAANNGTIENEITMTLSGTTFAKTGVLTQGTHYQFANMPTGHTVVITVVNGTTAKIKLDGVGTANGWLARKNLELKLLNEAFTSGNASAVLFSTSKFAVEYSGDVIRNTSTAKFDLNENKDAGGDVMLADPGTNIELKSTTYKFQNYDDPKDPNFGIKYVSFRKDAIADANFNLTPLDEGTVIGPSSSWKRGREYFTESGQHTVDSPNFTSWRGKTKFAGVRIRRSGRIFYGWTKIRVSTDGKIFEHLEYALNNVPDKEILAGRTPGTVIVIPPDPSVYCSGTAKPNSFFITNVKLANINNPTTVIEANGYSNFTSQIANLTSGKSEIISVTSNYNNATVPNNYNVWIDWNQNKVFDADEKVLSKNIGVTVSNTFAVPITAKTGNTRMRVRYSFGKTFEACGYDDYFGEVEDYTVNVSGTTFSGGTLPIPGGIFASSITSTGFLARFERPAAGNSVEVQILENGSWITLGTATINNFRINKRGSALNYTFRVRAVRGSETSNWTTPFDVVLPNSKIAFDQVTLEQQFKIYPNPSSDEIFFSVPEEASSNTKIEMYDISGRLVEKLLNAKRYNVNKLPKGIYQVKLISGGFIISKPIIVK
jgi:hypothetical protein